MKIRQFKQDIQQEIPTIPDIYDKIRPIAYQKAATFAKLPKKKKTFQFPKLATNLFPVFMIVLLVGFSFSVAPRNDYLVYETSESMKVVQDQASLNQVVKSSNLRNPTFFDTLSSVFDIFTTQSDPSEEDEAIRTTSITDNESVNITEPDIVQTDGNYIYSATKGTFRITKVTRGSLEPIYVESFSNAYTLNEYNFVSESSQIYSTEKYVIFLYHYIDLTSDTLSRNKTVLSIYQKDQIRTKSPIEKTEYSFDGELVSSRLIQNRLYVVSNAKLSSEAIRINQDSIPRPIINDQLVPFQNIQYLNGAMLGGYTIFASVLLEDTLVFRTRVELGSANWNIFYSTDERLYLASNGYSSTSKRPHAGILRYDYQHENASVVFHSSIFVRGKIASEYAMDEYNDVLRVVVHDKKDQKNKVLSFTEGTFRGKKQMMLVGELSRGIGSAGDIVQAVRFHKEEALIVTKGKTNAMYRIDLSDPQKPIIADIEPLENRFLSDIHYINDEFAIQLSFLDAFKGYRLVLFQLQQESLIEVDSVTVSTDLFFQSIEAIHNSNALFVDQIGDQYFIGFGVQELQAGTFRLYTLKPSEARLRFVKRFVEPTATIQRLIRITDDEPWFYVISDASMISYSLDFEPVDEIRNATGSN